MLLIYLLFCPSFTVDSFAAYPYNQTIFFVNGQMRRLYAFAVNEFAL